MTNERHPWNEKITGLLERIALGNAAKVIDPDDVPESGAVVCLPTWTWGLSGIDVGHKDRGPGGERLFLPVQVSWQPGPVLILEPGSEITVDHQVIGLGHSARGKTTAAACPGLTQPERVDSDSRLPVPVRVSAPVMSRRRILARLEELVVDGRLAYWQTTEVLEPLLLSAVRRAERQLTAEAAEGSVYGPGRALDATDVEAISNRMLLGEDDGEGAIPRLISRCSSPAALFARVDPQRYIVTSITRDAKAEVRKAVGDPHIGPKVRRLAIKLGTSELDVLLPAYRELYPADNLSVDRATAALGLWRRSTASHFSIYDADMPQPSFEDDLVERVDLSARRSAEMVRRIPPRRTHAGAVGAESAQQEGNASPQGSEVVSLESRRVQDGGHRVSA